MGTGRRILIWLCLLASACRVLGDGKLFPQVGFVRAETPSQRALIHWADGLQTLVIETTVQSQATNLAWILPLPAIPTSIRVVDPGLFPTLQTTFQARVEFGRSLLWIAGGMAVFGLLIFRWHREGKLPFSAFDYLLTLLVLMLCASLLLPALGHAKAGAAGLPEGTTLQILDERRAGVMDVATVTARKPEDLITWLRDGGFSAPETIIPIVRDYLSRGWVFATAKVSTTQPGPLAALHPIAFTFATPTPVYPMRLTGVGASSLKCDLYVFGPARARAPGWSVRYCARPNYSPTTNALTAPSGLRVRHAELARLVDRAPVATKLSRTLAGAAFDDDVELGWTAFRNAGQRAYTEAAAQTRALSAATIMLALGLLMARRAPRFRGLPIPWFHRSDLRALVAAGIVGVIAYGSLPRVELDAVKSLRRHPVYQAKNQILQWAMEAADTDSFRDLLHAERPISDPEFERARREFGTMTATLRYPIAWDSANWTLTNLFSSQRLRMESSPGNITLERTAQGMDVVWHDFDGYPALRTAIPKYEPPASTGAEATSP